MNYNHGSLSYEQRYCKDLIALGAGFPTNTAVLDLESGAPEAPIKSISQERRRRGAHWVVPKHQQQPQLTDEYKPERGDF